MLGDLSAGGLLEPVSGLLHDSFASYAAGRFSVVFGRFGRFSPVFPRLHPALGTDTLLILLLFPGESRCHLDYDDRAAAFLLPLICSDLHAVSFLSFRKIVPRIFPARP